MSTESPDLGSLATRDPALSQGLSRVVMTVEQQNPEMETSKATDISADVITISKPLYRPFSASVKAALPREININASPMQIWEGTVLEVDSVAGVMQVLLNAKMVPMPEHTGEIELEWVAEQDKELVRPGAVFYLTLFKRSNPSIENAQELRFRRRPAWSADQIKQIKTDAAMIISKMKALPTAP